VRSLYILPLAAVLAAAAACTPQSAHQANADLVTTSQEAAGASAAAKSERDKMAAITKDIQFDIKNLKEIEAFFDNDSRVIAFE
jgi:uncharacterized OsmC-like protein